jgi:hypothetical protein
MSSQRKRKRALDALISARPWALINAPGANAIPRAGGRPLYYRLDGRRAVVTVRWRYYIDSLKNRHVAETRIGKVRVSTIFLGSDHRHFGEGPPILFETMTFGPAEHLQIRYCTWKEAAAGHRLIVKAIRAQSIKQ